MTVTKIEAVSNSKNQYKIYVDEQFAFVLYKGELSRYHIKAGEDIGENVYREIYDEVIVKRAKLRALNLLNSMKTLLVETSIIQDGFQRTCDQIVLILFSNQSKIHFGQCKYFL